MPVHTTRQRRHVISFPELNTPLYALKYNKICKNTTLTTRQRVFSMLGLLNFAFSALLVPSSIYVSVPGNETTLDAILGPPYCNKHIQVTVNTSVYSAIPEIEVYGPKLVMPLSNVPRGNIQVRRF